ncbi:hypothetical protein OB955_09350 [Halobacteria archaeon AArc-m2/3/4]|uniref:Uncharacterized protein n=1 Tax=Natronoglomus mannanivorans TaxID=2979990 RepID=A0AAP2Z1A4_9EURY|nr:hypothetical protein [Halobacteria archaeon AArc-xg1-1]MCU4972947.1 hypothetical protein [Halobacteria archaeon AArc-m2/3/4]
MTGIETGTRGRRQGGEPALRQLTATQAISQSLVSLVRTPQTALALLVLVVATALLRLVELGTFEGATMYVVGALAVGCTLVGIALLARCVGLDTGYVDGTFAEQLSAALRTVPALLVANLLIVGLFALTFFVLGLFLSSTGAVLIGLPVVLLLTLQVLLIVPATGVEGRLLEGVIEGWEGASQYRLQLLGIVVGVEGPLLLVEWRLVVASTHSNVGYWLIVALSGVLLGVLVLSLARLYVDSRR